MVLSASSVPAVSSHWSALHAPSRQRMAHRHEPQVRPCPECSDVTHQYLARAFAAKQRSAYQLESLAAKLATWRVLSLEMHRTLDAMNVRTMQRTTTAASEGVPPGARCPGPPPYQAGAWPSQLSGPSGQRTVHPRHRHRHEHHRQNEPSSSIRLDHPRGVGFQFEARNHRTTVRGGRVAVQLDGS